MSTKFIQLPTCKLAEFAAAATTEFDVSGFLYNDGVTPVDPADIGDVCFATLEPKTAREELISFTINSVTAGGVATITATRGLSQKSPYGTGGAAFDHQNGSDLVISNNPGLFNKLAAKANDETITGSWQFPTPSNVNNPATKTYVDTGLAAEAAARVSGLATKVATTGDETVAGVKTFSSSPIIPDPTTDLQAATKKYVDDTAFAGTPNASETIKGIVEIATAAQVSAGTDTGETGAFLVVRPSEILSRTTTKSARVYQNTGTSLGTGNTDGAAMEFQVEAFDTNSFHDNAVNNSRLTIPTTGKYLVGGSMMDTGSNLTAKVQIKLNGTTFIAGSGFSGGNGITPTAAVSTIYEFTAGDYIELFGASVSSSRTSSGDIRTNFWITSI